MKTNQAFFLTILWLSLMPVIAAAQNNQISQLGLGLRQYLPGDIVHLVIEAPPDTNQIKAIMPDLNEVEMIYDVRSSLWNGYWEVPLGLKKGVYQARLVAGDVAGVSFQGKSAAFYIGEPVMALMMRISSREAAEEMLTERERIARERAIGAARLALEAERKAALSGETVQPRAIVTPPPAAVKPKISPKKPAVKRAAVKKRTVRVAVKRKPVVRTAQREDVNVTKARLTIAARSYLAKSQYSKAKAELRSLLKIEPNNREVRTIINRLEAVGRARGDN